MNKIAKNFLLSSEYDLTTAEYMFKSGRYVYVIFMCHMAIEKTIKAIIAEINDEVPPKTHNLLYLLKKADIKLPQEQFEFIAKINNASVITRYPEDFQELLKSYPENITLQYLNNTKEVIQCLRQNLRSKK